MTDPDLIGLFVAPLERLEIPYMVTGGVASVVYGDPRFTRGIDIVLELAESNVDHFVDAFCADDFYVPPREALIEEVRRRPAGHFNVIHRDTTLRADVYLQGDDALHSWAIERRLPLSVDGISVSIAPIEYVILRKLEYYRMSGSDRHLRDTAMMLRVSGEKVKRVEFERWIEALSLQAELTTAQAFRV